MPQNLKRFTSAWKGVIEVKLVCVLLGLSCHSLHYVMHPLGQEHGADIMSDKAGAADANLPTVAEKAAVDRYAVPPSPGHETTWCVAD